MALFRVITDTKDYSYATPRESSPKEVTNNIGEILQEICGREPDANVIEVRVVNRAW